MLDCSQFDIETQMMVGGGEWVGVLVGVGGFNGWRGQRGCDLGVGLYRVVAGPSEVNADNGLLEMPGLILSPSGRRSQSITPGHH